jgi:hypothetical protein
MLYNNMLTELQQFFVNTINANSNIHLAGKERQQKK